MRSATSRKSCAAWTPPASAEPTALGYRDTQPLPTRGHPRGQAGDELVPLPTQPGRSGRLWRGSVGPGEGRGVAVAGDRPSPFVDEMMVVSAQQDEVGQCGDSPVGPGDDVVGVGPGRRSGAAGEPAAAITDGEGPAECGGDEAGAAANVEGLPYWVQDDAGDTGVAGDAPGGLGMGVPTPVELPSAAPIGKARMAARVVRGGYVRNRLGRRASAHRKGVAPGRASVRPRADAGRCSGPELRRVPGQRSAEGVVQVGVRVSGQRSADGGVGGAPPAAAFPPARPPTVALSAPPP